MAFEPSPYQRAVYDHVAQFPDAPNLLVEAVAGSGKTTTLLGALEVLPEDLSVCFLAFNKSIATELGQRVPKGVVCKTFHALGFAAYRNAVDCRVQVEGKKTWKILDQLVNNDEKWLYGATVAKLVGLAKQYGIGVDGMARMDDYALWQHLFDHFDVQLKEGADLEDAIALAQRALEASIETHDMIDFDDMLYMPLVVGAGFQRFRVVFVDEAQDTNPLQIEIVRRLIAPRPSLTGTAPPAGKVVFVGDTRQAIYGFRGADSGAMDRIAEDFECTRLPLSVTYRCAKAIVFEAQEVAPEIEAHEGAEEGSVASLGLFGADDFEAADAVLCRNSAPLLSFAYRCIAEGKGVRFLGREIGQGLIKLIDRLKGRDIDSLLSNLRKWEEREMAAAIKDGREDKADSITDRASCIRVAVEALPERSRTVAGLRRSIEDVFDEKRGRMLTLATIHKSKGLEWSRVFLLDPHLLPSRWARQEWQQVQEDNLLYVAITRAKRELVYIDSDGWRS